MLERARWLVAHTFNSRTRQTEADESLRQSGIQSESQENHRETLSWEKKQKKKEGRKQKESRMLERNQRKEAVDLWICLPAAYT